MNLDLATPLSQHGTDAVNRQTRLLASSRTWWCFVPRIEMPRQVWTML